MLEIVTQFALATLGLALLLALVRLVKGPTLPDRVVAMDLLGVLVVGLIVVLAASTGVRATLDAAIVIALIGFVARCVCDVCRARATGMIDVMTAILWLVGSAFALLAAVGVLRMPDVFTRMQASTKASTLGLGCLLRRRRAAVGRRRVVHPRREHRRIPPAHDPRVGARDCTGGVPRRHCALGGHGARRTPQ